VKTIWSQKFIAIPHSLFASHTTRYLFTRERDILKSAISRHAWDIRGRAKVLSQMDYREVRSRIWTGPKAVRSNIILKICTFTLEIATIYFPAVVTATFLRHNTENGAKHAGETLKDVGQFPQQCM
jgi:hypothetical protein